jgi:predicted small lipoprotein YifL
MRHFLLLLAAIPLAACGGDGDDALADQAREAGEQQAEATLANGGTQAAADQLEEAGEERAERIDDSDIDTDALSEEQKAALVTGGNAQ